MKLLVEINLGNKKPDEVYERWIKYCFSKTKHAKYNIVSKVSTATFDEIEKAVCKVTGRTPSEIQLVKRNREVVEARQLCHHISKLCIKPKKSLAAIGQRFGNKDHATVLHSSKTVLNLLETDSEYRLKYQPLIYKFENDTN